MKTPPFLLIGCPVIVLIGAIIYFATFRELHQTPFHAALIEAETPAASSPLHEILVQLDLTDAQQRQIDQIRQTTSDRTQRRQAIFNILTPGQRARFQELRAQRQKEKAAAISATNAP
jgi:Spy/CpxP family protein refolding chaperone